MLHGHGIFLCFLEGRARMSLFRNQILRIELTRKLRNLQYENFVIVWRRKSGITNWTQIGFCATSLS